MLVLQSQVSLIRWDDKVGLHSYEKKKKWDDKVGLRSYEAVHRGGSWLAV